MKVLIDINHPGHVHFFKNLISKLKEKSYKVIIIASDKDITVQLLREYKLDFIQLPKNQKGLISKIYSLFMKEIYLFLISLKIKPDIYIGIASIPCAHISWIFRKRCIIFDDTEHSKYEIALYKPFVREIYTPKSFVRDLGQKQIRYDGFHELAYLDPSVFKPNEKILSNYGINYNQKFFVLRFIGWNAFHDINQIGMSLEEKINLISLLEPFGKVYISSENPLPKEFEKYRLTINIKDIHHLLAFAHFFIGESGTMATEASLLGTYSIIINPLAKMCGNHIELKKWEIQSYFDSYIDIKDKINDYINDDNLRKKTKINNMKMLETKINLNDYIMHIL